MSQYEAHRMKDPTLPFIFHFGHRRFDCPADPGNWHENVELLYVTEGQGWVSCNEERLSVREGDVIVLNTNCLHTISTNGDIRYACLIIDRSFCLANHFDTNRIHFQHLIQDEELRRWMDRLIEEYRLEEATPYRAQGIRATVLQIMTLLGRQYSREEKSPGNDTHLLACMKQALGYIHSESHRELSLEEIAELVGLSKYYFAREFHRITGYTFVAYVNLIRCEKAKQLLAEDQMSIGNVGRCCGFPHASYFTRTFLHLTGSLPSSYRESRRRNLSSQPSPDEIY
ncbi:MAG: helix-turn-helix transcriptional regulator [Clostridia bacterium]|nr:helix-turn-helix transcriptional regulator [Clostridia bacterium]